MTPPRRGPARRVAVGYALFAGVLALGTAPLYFSVAASGRILVLRAAGALFLGVALVHLVRRVRAVLAAQPPSEFERALGVAASAISLHPDFVRLRHQIRYSVESRDYFEYVLRPRLLVLAGSDGVAADLAPVPRRRWGRGPSLPSLERLIARIEGGK